MENKELNENLSEYLKRGVLLTFSGGVDSSLLLYLLSQLKGECIAVYFKTNLLFDQSTRNVQEIAEKYHVPLLIEQLDFSEDENIVNNCKDRCYYCKKQMYEKAKEIALTHDLEYVLDGMIMDDLSMYRPGIKAHDELGIKSPFIECEIYKKDILALAEKYQLSVSKTPSLTCFATRFPYDTKIDDSKFIMIQEGERYLKEIGFLNVRIRMYGDSTRIEVDQEMVTAFVQRKDEIINHLKLLGFQYVCLDLEGYRTGSMDEVF